MTQTVRGIPKTLDMAHQPAWSGYRSGAVDTPERSASDDDIATRLRTVANTEHDPTSTCRMGTDERSVTGNAGRVHLLERLRVVDGSILLLVPSANTNASIIMAAEKIAASLSRG